MRTQELNYYLPKELIAQTPAKVRSDARLLVLDRQKDKLIDAGFSQLAQILRQGDCLVFNDTKVLQARFFARRATGGRLEGIFLAEPEPQTWQVMLKGAGKLKPEETFFLTNNDNADFCCAKLLEKQAAGKCLLKIDTLLKTETVLEAIGLAPLPPYIKRAKDKTIADIDKIRYQTVYAAKPGAVAAPTAGLHFTDRLIKQLKDKSVTLAYLTLHVGIGTFKPVTAENLEDHKIHREWFSIDAENADLINQALHNRQRIIAVGTTSVRVLETVAAEGMITPTTGTTDLFITPGYKFKVTDAIITNFHLPKSTLLALICAFAGTEKTLAAYNHAIDKRYRFYSYGDAMLII